MAEEKEETEGCLRRGLGTGFTASAAAAATGMTLPMWGHAIAVAALMWFLMICGGGGYAGQFPYRTIFLENIELFGPMAVFGLLFFVPTVAAACLGGVAVLLRGAGFRRTSAVMLILSLATGLTTLSACAVESAAMLLLVRDAPNHREEEPVAPEPAPQPAPAPAPRRGKRPRRP